MSTRRDSLFELRSYSARPGQRDALIGMFESLFLDAYQASGARIGGGRGGGGAANVEEAILLRAVREEISTNCSLRRRARQYPTACMSS